MSVGKIYFSIDDSTKSRVAGIKFVDDQVAKDITFTKVISKDVSLFDAYLSMMVFCLQTYINMVAEKKWIKYDRINLITDSALDKLYSNFDRFEIDRLDNMRFNLVSNYNYLSKLVGGVRVKSAELSDKDWNTVKLVISKTLGGNDGNPTN